jgi:hypothetical protein
MESHPDRGFGIVAMQFYDLARKAVPAKGTLEHLPVNFLYRHSCELYLKSLIILLRTAFSSVKSTPEEMVDQISREHSIEKLFKELQDIYIANKPRVDELTEVDWKPAESLEVAVRTIVGYDDGSTYFRYPISRDKQKDKKKDHSKEIKPEKLSSMGNDKPGMFTVLLNQNEEVVKVYQSGLSQDERVTESLAEVSEYLHCFHIAVRMRFFDGK